MENAGSVFDLMTEDLAKSVVIQCNGIWHLLRFDAYSISDALTVESSPDTLARDLAFPRQFSLSSLCTRPVGGVRSIGESRSIQSEIA